MAPPGRRPPTSRVLIVKGKEKTLFSMKRGKKGGGNKAFIYLTLI